MWITDLPYLVNVPEDELILGSAQVSVNATASAFGNSSNTMTFANTKARFLSNGSSIAVGKGKSIAVGNNPTANVQVTGDGDMFFVKSISKSSTSTAVSSGSVIAVDMPNS